MKRGSNDQAAKNAAVNPSPGQKESGNYRKGHVIVHGLRIAIENPRGSTRKGIDKDGEPWSVKMPDHYGYIKASEGADGDEIDVYVGPDADSDRVFVIDQIDADTSKFDEHKAMLGYETAGDAIQAFLKAFSDNRGHERIGGVKEMPVGEFREWLEDSDTQKPTKAIKRAGGGRIPMAQGVQADDWIAPSDDWVTPETPAKTASPPIGQAEAFATGAKQGLTANFGDELTGLNAASGLPNWAPNMVGPIPVKLMTAAARAGADALSGGTGTKAAYETARDKSREETKAAQDQFPLTTLAGNAAGAIAIPVPGLGSASMAARAGKSALAGAGYGSVYGAGEGEDLKERATKALTGAGFGAAVGSVAPFIIRGAEKAGEAVSNVVAPAFQKFRGAVDAESEASKRIANAAIKHFEERGTPLTKEQIDVLSDVGNPQALIDLLGERGHAIARSAANQSPEARGILKDFIEPRFEAQSSRAMEMVRSLVKTPANATETRDALNAVNPTLRPLYQKAYMEGSKGIADDELREIASTNLMIPIIKDAAIAIESKMVTGRASHPLSETGSPTLEFWDQVKRTLDSKITVARRAGDKEYASDLGAIRSKIIEKMDEAVPSYATARGVAHEFFKAADALEAGEKFVTGSKMPIAEARKAVAKMSDEEKALFAEGYASALVERLEKSSDRRSILNHIGSSPAARERMEIALGKNEASKFKTYLEVESLMDRARTAMGNSTTARQLMEMGMAGTGAGLAMGDFSPQNIATGALLWRGLKAGSGMAQKRLTTKATRNLAEETARMLVSNDPTVIRKGVEAIQRNARFRNSIRAFDEDLAKVASQHPPAISSGAVPSRAEGKDDQ